MSAETGPACASELLEVVGRAAAELARVSDADASRRPAPGRWSAKEIVGHLIDSAANNHARFVSARHQANLVFPGYAQDDWVRDQAYQSAPWPELVELWSAYNRHVARVMTAIPGAVRVQQHRRHNLDQIAWRAVAAGEPTTLEYLMQDYVDHLKHHLRQIAGLFPGVSRPSARAR